MHRPSNVDDRERLQSWISSLTAAARSLNLCIVFPIHPRTKIQLDQAKIKMDETIFHAIEPVGYLDLLRLQASAELVLTDSGGLQEEACILRVPCVTLRANTERPETVHVGANTLHNHPDKDLLEAVMRAAMGRLRQWENPFGDGQTGVRVMDILQKE